MTSSSKLIMVVDDEPGLCETFQDLFGDRGYDVRIAQDGAQALEVLESLTARPCMIICDVIMPVMDGNEFHRHLKAHAVFATVPVLFMTSDPSRSPAGQLFMKKPVNFDVLLEAVRRCCDASVSVAS